MNNAALPAQPHTAPGRAKDLGSAAVMFCLLQVLWLWAVALWP